jgi:DHA3 family macrolide efflux protein-like MFS transporter
VLLGGIAVGLVAGLLAGGSISNVAEVRLRWMGALFLAVVVRFGTEAALTREIPVAETLRLPLLVTAYLILLTGLWANRRQPGMAIALIGILSNAVVIGVNGGRMPIWEPSLAAAGLTLGDVPTALHNLLPASLDGSFLVHLGPFGDVIPIPLSLIRNVASVGDLLISIGLGFFLFATVLRTPGQATEEEEAERDAAEPFAGLAGTARLTRGPGTHPEMVGAIRSETGLVVGFAEASILVRPILLGGPYPGLADPSSVTVGVGVLPRPTPGLAERARRHPYVRLALNTSFSALWTSGLISLFGDRIHQVALAFIVLEVTKSPIAVGFVFLAATLPNLLLGPFSGTLVDRWDQKQVLVVSDLLRAAVVLLIPLAAVTHILLVYPLVFLVTSISIFFRPAREAVMPRIVADDELLTANSANWLAESLADTVGYPVAGLFVAFLGTSLPLAFWLDASTYLASALLILTVAIPPVPRGAAEAAAGVLSEMRVGWRFLRSEPVLLANTAQAVIAQFATGVLISVTIVYAAQALQRGALSTAAVYAFLDAGIGIGNLVGGFAVGLVGARIAKGRLVIVGYSIMGACVLGLGLTGNVGIAMGLMVGVGIANMVYVIPSQTLFQERTPKDMIGRVVGMRFAVVFGSLTLAMGVGGFLAASLGVTTVLIMFGGLTCAAGLAGILVPAVRDA